MCSMHDASHDSSPKSIGLSESLDETLLSLPAVSLFGENPNRRLMALCVEPGMGRSQIITGIFSRCIERGYSVERRSFSGMTSDEAASLLVRLARRLSRQSGAVALALDDLPPADESGVRREARALRRLWEAHVPVVFSLAPEGSQLLEALPECFVLGLSDVLVPLVAEARHGDAQYPIKRLTRGIPSLVLSLTRSETRAPERGAPYLSALSELVGSSLRLSLTDDELRLRLAMLLLGRGTVSELAGCVSDVSREALGALRMQSPLFGVSERLHTFSCLGDPDTLLEAGHARLAASCALFPEVGVAALRALSARGDFARAAHVCPLCGAEEGYPVVLEHAAGFLDAGETAVLQKACAAFGDALVPRLGLIGRALDALCLSDPAPEVLSVEEDDLLVAHNDERDLLMLIDARRVMRGEPLDSRLPEDGWTACGRRFLVHREATELMSQGCFGAALRVLLTNPASGDVKTVSAALLCLDLELARIMLCDAAVLPEEELARARGLLDRPSLRGLGGYGALQDVVHALLAGDLAGATDADGLVARAERQGDVLVQAVALVAGCLFDLRRGACARAHVRSLLAVTVARRARSEYLARVAGLVGTVARFLLGERVELDVCASPRDDLDRVSALVAEALRAEDDALGEELPQMAAPPREALWLLLVLCEGMGDFSALLRREVPATWRQTLFSARVAWPQDEEPLEGDFIEGELRSVGVWGTSAERQQGAPVRLCLLGKFAVSVNGARADEGKLGHRNVISLLEYLALQEGAAIKRYQVVEQVWPECDYATGFNKIYQATSSLRTTLAALGAKVQPFVSSRASRTMALNTNVVACDVDEFRLCAKGATDNIDDVRAVEMARRAEQLYKGDLFVPPMDATGFVASLRERLRVLYADAMVAGADAALRLGKRRTAARLAGNALLADDQREDAEIAMVQALRASGRNAEADQHYRRYAHRLAKTAQREPSRLLRRAAGEAAAGSHPAPEGVPAEAGEELREIAV